MAFVIQHTQPTETMFLVTTTLGCYEWLLGCCYVSTKMFKMFLVCCYAAVCSGLFECFLVGHSNVFRIVYIVLLCNSWMLRLVSRVLLGDSKTWLDNYRVLWVVARVFLCLENF